VSAARVERLAALVGEEGLDQLIVGDLVRPGDSSGDATANTRWLTGFGGTSAISVVGPDARVFITDFRYTERAEEEVGDDFERVTAAGRLLPELASRLSGRVGFDDTATSVANLAKVEAELGEGVELVPAGGLVERLRRRKDETELAAIAEAARIADDAYESVLAGGLGGRTEREVATAVHARIRELVRVAQRAGLDAVGAGIGGEQADEAARAVIRDGGRGDNFGHGLGHGVGLEVHEAPRLGKLSEDVLEPGDVVTVEPGVYVPGEFGIRIEDLVSVTEDGYRNLSSLPKELRVVE